MTRMAPRFDRLAMAGAVAMLMLTPAQAATRSDQPVQAWSAMDGIPVVALLEQAQDMPVSDLAIGDQPYCAEDAEIHQTLLHDFREQPVDTSHEGTQLWGSDDTGTWTLVAPRADGTSCIIASGIGFKASADVEVYYKTAGLR